MQEKKGTGPTFV